MSSKQLPNRFKSASVDLAVWTLIWFVVGWTTDKLVRTGLGTPNPTGPDPRDELSIVSFGFAALCANLYLAMSAAKGRSVGKALFGLRVIVADSTARPGLARGLVRSSLQAGPWMGVLMVLTGAHDAFAGTRIIADEQDVVEQVVGDSEHPNRGSHVATWKVALAIVLHLFIALVYMFVGAI